MIHKSNVQGRWGISNYIYYNNTRLHGTLDGNMFFKKKWKKLKSQRSGTEVLRKKEDA